MATQRDARIGRCFRNQVLAVATQPACVLEFEPDFERRSSFGDACTFYLFIRAHRIGAHGSPLAGSRSHPAPGG